MQDIISAFGFIFANLHVAGWLYIIYATVRISLKLSRFLDKMTKGLHTLELLATNHLPHLQQGLDDLNDNVLHLAEDSKETKDMLVEFLINNVKK